MTLSLGGTSSSGRNHFAVLGLPVRFALDLAALERAWRAVQGAVHPDRFAGAGEAQRRLALQYSTQINEAHDILKDPVRRASYLCGLHGVDVDAERNTAMPAEFLMQQMEWRESLEDAVQARQPQTLAQLAQDVQSAITEGELLLEHLLDRAAPDYDRAAMEVRRMMFLMKFSQDLLDQQKRLSHGAVADR